MKRALIVTVGTGTRPDVYIVKPLVKSIRDSRPDFLVLVATPESRKFAAAILAELQWPQNSSEVKILNNFDDFQLVCREVNQVFDLLQKHGYKPEDVQLDFTSGTKAMSVGAVYAAISNQCQSIKYITGERQNGVVMDGSEKFLTFAPNTIYTLHDVRLAEELTRRLRFATADEILGNLPLNLLDSQERAWAESLRSLAQGYRFWDIFDHAKALQKFKKVDWDLPAAAVFRPSPAGLEHLSTLAASPDKINRLPLLLDLYNNALRRGREGKYDDAVARFYRAVELFSQHLLSSPPYEIDSGNVELAKAPPVLHDLLDKNRDPRDGCIKIGLVLNYRVLAELGHPVGDAFLASEPLQGRLRQRNDSILAHGLKPITESVFRKLQSDLLPLFTLAQPTFSEEARSIQFPWLIEQ